MTTPPQTALDPQSPSPSFGTSNSENGTQGRDGTSAPVGWLLKVGAVHFFARSLPGLFRKCEAPAPRESGNKKRFLSGIPRTGAGAGAIIGRGAPSATTETHAESDRRTIALQLLQYQTPTIASADINYCIRGTELLHSQ